MGTIIIGILMVVVGVLAVVKTEWIIQNFGTNAWAEAKFGFSGGSRIFYKLIGLGIIFIGFIIMTGMWEGFLIGTVGKIFIR